jgi:hypothetical protein
MLSIGGLLVLASVPQGIATINKRFLSAAHGISLFLLFITGFGALARMQIRWPLPEWVVFKILIWLVLGGIIAFISRKPAKAKMLWWVVLFLAALASYMAIHKPGF